MQPDQKENEYQPPASQPTGSPFVAPADASQPAPVSAAAPVETVPSTPPTSTPEPTATSDTPISVDEAPQPIESPAVDPKDEAPVHWQATEYIHHEKTVVWYVVFGFVVAALMAIAIFWMKAWTFALLIPVMAVALVMYTHRPPRVINYTLSRQGLHINDQLYPFSTFKGFGVIHDGAEYSVVLLPTKRFQPGVSVYFPEESGEAIVDMLGVRLPMQELHLDLLDKIIRKLRV